jgi:hypothetical protein
MSDDWRSLDGIDGDFARPGRLPDSTTTIAMLNLRELARKTEEAAVLLEGAGYQVLPGQLLQVSERLTEIRQALERLSSRGG